MCEVVELEVTLEGGEHMKMTFLSVPLICEPISGQSTAYAINNYKGLASLEFSDYSQGDSDLKVDILVGLDVGHWKDNSRSQWAYSRAHQIGLGVVWSSSGFTTGYFFS